jgi:hypothetical protein
VATPSEILDAYRHISLEGANEADTRLKVINDILYDVLGWTHSDVHTEERVSEDGKTTWADYVLRTGMTAIVIEAKKVGVPFSEVPDARRSNLHGKLVTGETGAAIIQARDYARKLSIPFACVTNGDKWIVFPATRVDQVAFSESSAIIFPSLKSVLDTDFAEFHDLFSRDAVIKGNLESELLGRIENQIEDRRLNRFFTTSFSKISRHSLFPLIEDAITTAFSEDIVTTSTDLLEKCYVRTPERIRFDSRIGLHIARRNNVTSRAAFRPLKTEQGINVSEIIAEAATRARPIAILVLGQVGAGKTTFLEFTRRVSSQDVFEVDNARPYPHWMRIDFKPFTRGESPITFILEQIKQLIAADPFLSSYDRCIQHAYKAEIDALFRGPLFLLANDEGERKRRVSDLLMTDYKATRPYVEKIIRYAAERVPVFVTIDNIDQVENDGDQAAVFADAMAFAQTTKINLICSMREATFVNNRTNPLFDAFDFDPIVIDPPNIQAVLSKRFFVARQLLEGKSGRFTAENGADVHVSSLSTVIDLVQTSVLGTELGNLIEVLATSDIRLALRMTREFLQSGWTASGKALRIYQTTGKYVMPQHEALRAIMLGNQQVYYEEFSVIGNPFDAKLAKTEAQLMRLYILSAIAAFSANRSFRYLEGTEIQRCLRELGFGDNIALKVIEDLCKMRFLHTVSHTPPSLEASFIVSRLGGYIVRHFIGDMMFLENAMMDTFVSDRQAWDSLKGLTTAIYAERDTLKRMSLRKQRVLEFFLYMKKLYEPLKNDSVRRGLPKEWCLNPLEEIENEFQRRLTRVMSSAQRNYGSTDGTRARDGEA